PRASASRCSPLAAKGRDVVCCISASTLPALHPSHIPYNRTMHRRRTIGLRCPTCKKIVLQKEPDFPFCSERCRLIDLGKWASGGYVVSTPINEADQFGDADYAGPAPQPANQPSRTPLQSNSDSNAPEKKPNAQKR